MSSERQRIRQVSPAEGDDPLGAGVFASNAFPPAARPGDHVYLLPIEEEYRVERIRPIADILTFNSDDGDDVTLVANDFSDKIRIEPLQVDDDRLFQARPLRIGQDLPADVRIFVDQLGRESPLHSTKNQRGFFTRETGLEVGHDGTNLVANDDFVSSFMELWQYEDEDLFFQFEEVGGATPTVADIRWSGYIYKLTPEQVSSARRRAVPVPIGPLGLR